MMINLYCEEHMSVTVRPLREDDYSQWRPLWDGYTHFYECYLEESVTASTWERALSAQSSMFCRVVEKDEKVIGFAMCILHEGTWSTAPICYLEDLFVDAAERGAGAGKALIDALIAEGKREGWSKLYWVTRENNPARKLYDQYGEADDYVRYRLSL
jgi:GNAT superfamily N-acetyltransferase